MVAAGTVTGPKRTLYPMVDDPRQGLETVRRRTIAGDERPLCRAPTFVGLRAAAVRHPAALQGRAEALKLIQMLSAGYDRADLEARGQEQVPCATRRANSVAVSEHAMCCAVGGRAADTTQHANVVADAGTANGRRPVHEVRNKVWHRWLGTTARRWRAAQDSHVVPTTTSPGLKEEQEDALGGASACCPEIMRVLRTSFSLHVPLKASTRAHDRAPTSSR